MPVSGRSFSSAAEIVQLSVYCSKIFSYRKILVV